MSGRWGLALHTRLTMWLVATWCVVSPAHAEVEQDAQALAAGACCLCTGACIDTTPETCANFGGDYLGSDQFCWQGEIDCITNGRCCLPCPIDGVLCLDSITISGCLAFGGSWSSCESCSSDPCPPPTDCNLNGIPDDCDIEEGVSQDCDANGIPDECDPDCDGDGTPDNCEGDCNGDGIPDGCETSGDCNLNSIPDSCENLLDCNLNGNPDECDIIEGFSNDCDGNNVPDECDPDCDLDGVSDSCEADCDADGIPDDCQPSLDCNENGIPDRCDLQDLTSEDCNFNGVPDECCETCDGDPLLGACCIGQICVPTTITGCGQAGGLWSVVGRECADLQCLPQDDCFGDLTEDGMVDFNDLVRLIANWGVCP